MRNKIISINHIQNKKENTNAHKAAREYILDEYSFKAYLDILETPISEEITAIGFFNAETGQLLLDTQSEGHIYSALDFDILTEQNDLKDNWFGIILGIYNNRFTFYDQSGQFGKLPSEDLVELKIILDKCFGSNLNNNYRLQPLTDVLKESIEEYNAEFADDEPIKMFFFEGSALYMQLDGKVDIQHMRDLDIALVADTESDDEFLKIDRINMVKLIEKNAKKAGLKVVVEKNRKEISILINNKPIRIELDGYPSYDEWIDSNPALNYGVRDKADVQLMFDLNAGEKITEEKITYKWIKKYLETEHLLGDINIHAQILNKFINCPPSNYIGLMKEIEHNRVPALKEQIDNRYTEDIDIMDFIKERMYSYLNQID